MKDPRHFGPALAYEQLLVMMFESVTTYRLCALGLFWGCNHLTMVFIVIMLF